jgi:hypothetical protein
MFFFEVQDTKFISLCVPYPIRAIFSSFVSGERQDPMGKVKMKKKISKLIEVNME